MVETEISVFRPNSRKKEVTIRSLIPKQAVDALAERLGQDAADTAERVLRTMKRQDMDFVQLHIGERRVRIKQAA